MDHTKKLLLLTLSSWYDVYGTFPVRSRYVPGTSADGAASVVQLNLIPLGASWVWAQGGRELPPHGPVLKQPRNPSNDIRSHITFQLLISQTFG